MIEFLVLQVEMGKISVDKIPLKYREEVIRIVDSRRQSEHDS